MLVSFFSWTSPFCSLVKFSGEVNVGSSSQIDSIQTIATVFVCFLLVSEVNEKGGIVNEGLGPPICFGVFLSPVWKTRAESSKHPCLFSHRCRQRHD